jgi:hypothetical protein
MEWQIAQRTKTLTTQHPNPNPHAIQVFVMAVSGAAITVLAVNNETVSSFKAKVAAKTGIPTAQQTLAYCGKGLNDQDKLSSHRIQNGATVVMAVRVAGGMQLKQFRRWSHRKGKSKEKKKKKKNRSD